MNVVSYIMAPLNECGLSWLKANSAWLWPPQEDGYKPEWRYDDFSIVEIWG